jgi:hypothetical protein
MKHYLFYSLMVLFVIGSLFSGCSNEQEPTMSAPSGQQTGIQPVTFDAMPLVVRQTFEHNQKQINELFLQRDEHFGLVLEEHLYRQSDSSGIVSYVGAMSRASSGALDNMVVKQYPDGSVRSNIIRYLPDCNTPGQPLNMESFTGSIEIYSGEGDFLSGGNFNKGQFNNSRYGNTANGGSCYISDVQYALGCVYTCWISSITITVTCHGGSGGGIYTSNYTDEGPAGGSGGGGTGNSGGGFGGDGSEGEQLIDIGVVVVDAGEGIEEDAPSCRSFHYRNTTSTWQEANVKDVRFRIVVLDPHYVRKPIDIHFYQPINFGLPSNFHTGDNLSALSAAELTAFIMKYTMDEIVHLFGNKMVTESFLRAEFRGRLISNFREFTGGGGRVQFNYTGTGVVTPYQTTFFGSDDCND